MQFDELVATVRRAAEEKSELLPLCIFLVATCPGARRCAAAFRPPGEEELKELIEFSPEVGELAAEFADFESLVARPDRIVESLSNHLESMVRLQKALMSAILEAGPGRSRKERRT